MSKKKNTTVQVDRVLSPTSTLTTPLPDPEIPSLGKAASEKNGDKGSNETKVDDDDDEFEGIQRIFNKGPYSPENNAWLLSRVSLWWLNGFFKRGYKKRVEEDDLYEMLDHNKAGYLGRALTENWEAERQRAALKGKEPSLLRAVVATFWRSYYTCIMGMELGGKLMHACSYWLFAYVLTVVQMKRMQSIWIKAPIQRTRKLRFTKKKRAMPMLQFSLTWIEHDHENRIHVLLCSRPLIHPLLSFSSLLFAASKLYSAMAFTLCEHVMQMCAKSVTPWCFSRYSNAVQSGVPLNNVIHGSGVVVVVVKQCVYMPVCL